MIFFKTIIVHLLLSLVGYCSCQSEEEVLYLTNLVKDNILKAQTYKLPTYFEGFEVKNSQTTENFGAYDFIIVGAGAGGSLLARRLSEIHDWSVLLLEGGGRENDFVQIPAVFNHLYNSEYNWGFTTTPQIICKDNLDSTCQYPRGKGLGGTTLIHTIVHARGTAFDYNKWADSGLKGWTFQEILPFFKKYENASLLKNIDPDYHGFNGPLVLENYLNASAIDKAFIEALEGFGFKPTDYNGENVFGYGAAQKTTILGKRCSAAKAFLSSVENRSNLKIQTNSLVTKILIDDERVRGVEFIHGHRKFVATANKEVILSAGSVGSPQILMLSGIGPSEDLLKHNITVLKDLPVGKMFQDRPGVTVLATTNYTEESNLEALVEQYLNGYGPLSVSQRTEIAFYKSKRNNIMEVMFLDGIGLQIVNGTVSSQEDEKKTIGIRTALLHPKSVGNLSLKSRNPLEFPTINTNILKDSEDLNAMIDALNFIIDILDTEPMRKFNATFKETTSCGRFPFRSRQYWECYLRTSMSDHALHPIASCKMGTNSTSSVVNEKLQVHGIKGLRVVDASVMPTFITGHQFGAVFMIAEKAADMIFETYRKRNRTMKVDL